MAATLPSRTLYVSSEHAGQRIDYVVRRALPEVTRVALRELFAAGSVRLNGSLVRKAAIVAIGDTIEIAELAPQGPAVDPTLVLSVLHEDRWLVAVDKPAGVPSHALRAGERGTVVSALLARYPEMRGVGYRELESGLLHRLDTETSGILVAARDQTTFARLREAHVRGELSKRYLALVTSKPELTRTRAFLRADSRKVRVRLEPFEGAKPVQLALESVKPYGAYSLVCVQVALAARHQVRAQLAALGHPIAGDALYGGEPLPGLSRHFLHASELELPHPDGTRLRLRSELPDELRAVLAALLAED